MSRRRSPTALLIAALAAFALILATNATGASAKTVWLCKPGSKPDPCKGSLKTTVVKPGGTTTVDDSAQNAKSRCAP